MSWQAYVDTSLVGTGNIDKAAIFNSEGTSVWAASPGFTVCTTSRFRGRTATPTSWTAYAHAWGKKSPCTLADLPSLQVGPAEINTVATSFADNSDVKKVQSEGFHIATEKFFTIKSDDRSLYGKKGKEGVVAVKTQQAILVAHYPDTVQPGAAATTVEQLGDYLISVGY
ncbi:MAG: hypothetical protein Q9186_005128 [Xanthomendoza sp. 1 TL-2023]